MWATRAILCLYVHVTCVCESTSANFTYLKHYPFQLMGILLFCLSFAFCFRYFSLCNTYIFSLTLSHPQIFGAFCCCFRSIVVNVNTSFEFVFYKYIRLWLLNGGNILNIEYYNFYFHVLTLISDRFFFFFVIFGQESCCHRVCILCFLYFCRKHRHMILFDVPWNANERNEKNVRVFVIIEYA